MIVNDFNPIQVFKAAREAEENRKREYDAAIHIQAVMRGVRLRQFVKYLHMCAVRIQVRISRDKSLG